MAALEELEAGPPRPARSMARRFAAAALAIVVLTAAGSATAVLLEVNSTLGAFRVKPALRLAPGVLDPVDAGGPQTLLLLGSDRRYADRQQGIKPRSDTIILVRLDPAQNATAILNIPRDLKVTYTRPNGARYSDKINAAFEKGGPEASVRKVKELMTGIDGRPFDINHVVSINFGAFSKAVDRLGCFYVDVDRRYFNDNNPPYMSADGSKYATIDLEPGYQKLCGQDALDFVRFRHLDTDIVRGARQQQFLAQAKDQVGIDQLFRSRRQLLATFGRYTDTDISSDTAILRLIKLAIESSRSPLRRVNFPAIVGPSYVTATDAGLRRMKRQFVSGQASAGPVARPRPTRRRVAPRAGPTGGVPGLDPAPQLVDDRAVLAATKLPFPVYAPRYVRTGGELADGFRGEDVVRTYSIRDREGRLFRTYRMTFNAGGYGDFYGVQGTNWRTPPIIANPNGTQRIGERTFLLFRDGSKLRLVAWKTARGVYWISNTLLRTLTNRQMLGLASSLTRAGRASG